MMSWLNAYLEEISSASGAGIVAPYALGHGQFVRLFPVIARQARNAIPERSDLRDAVLNTWENHYPLNQR